MPKNDRRERLEWSLTNGQATSVCCLEKVDGERLPHLLRLRYQKWIIGLIILLDL